MSPVPEQPTASSSAPQLKHVLVPSAKKHKKFVFHLDADLGQIVWESVSKQQRISKWLLFLSYFCSANEDSSVRLRTGLMSYVARVLGVSCSQTEKIVYCFI